MTTILIVEDDNNQRLLYEQELKLEGYKIVTASDGKEALEKVQETAPRYYYNGHKHAKDGWY